MEATMYWAVVGIPIPRMKQANIVNRRVKKRVTPFSVNRWKMSMEIRLVPAA